MLPTRMESNGIPGKIQVTPALYDCLKDKFLLKMRGAVEIQGKGEMMVYWLVARKELLMISDYLMFN